MNRMSRKMVRNVMVVCCIGMLALFGCPKKAEISVVPETPREEAPAAAAVVQPPAEALAQPGQKVEAATPEVEAPKVQAAAPAGLQPVFFDYNRAIIQTGAYEIMRANAEWLKANPQTRIRIEGNCDERGTIEYNQALGQRRAASAKEYLTDMGVSGERITLIAYGKEKPSCTESTENCWQKNRRGDFVVVATE